MRTEGGTISGNWVIGKEVIASKPRKTITTEMTPDRIGRLMNISNIRLTYYFRLHQTIPIVYGPFRHPQSQA